MDGDESSSKPTLLTSIELMDKVTSSVMLVAPVTKMPSEIADERGPDQRDSIKCYYVNFFQAKMTVCTSGVSRRPNSGTRLTFAC